MEPDPTTTAIREEQAVTAPRGLLQRTRRAMARVKARLQQERGAATAEYAIVIMAAVGFAGLLVVIMRSEEVRAILTNLVQTALTSGG